MIPVYLILALLAAFFHSVSGLYNKQAMAHGCSPLRIFMMQAWIGSLLMSPLLFYGAPVPPSMWWQPVVTALFWFSGAAVFVYTLRDGDLSIVGPVAGIKPVFNALLIALVLQIDVPAATWIACGLAAIALAVMRTPSSRGSHSFKRTALQTLLAMLLFAITDLCIQRWAQNWGALRFSSLLFLGGSLCSLSLYPMMGMPYRELPAIARRNLWIGTPLASLPGILIGVAIGQYGHGAEINIGYSSHVLITLPIVWFLGRHVGNHEHKAGRGVFIRRFIGAAILLVAILLTLQT